MFGSFSKDSGVAGARQYLLDRTEYLLIIYFKNHFGPVADGREKTERRTIPAWA